ncbi:hypothetical protein CPB84DRAFT_1843965 [Gymnopilus junonius]|uniref:Uncharacterized protein n=1 Tax=Gymnopilus junonius TaxID=109634 RepID=A0A9P5TS90_GYMJU|nr:hypothetical protein CPB84DRAFT_1843965 [Gymnopilus junonius]
MVNPGAFQGARKAFLMGKKEFYSQAVDDGFVAEAVAKIQLRYFKRFPIDSPEEEDPSPEDLAAVDDDAIEPNYQEPDPEKMTSKEYEEAMEKLGSRQRKIAFHRGQIKCWLAYQYMKDHDINSKASGEFIQPRARTPCNVWHKTQRAEIEKQVKIVAAEKSIGKSGLAALRTRLQKKCTESSAAQKAWEAEVSGPPSAAPQDHQRCILGLIHFMHPILDLVCEATGWKASFIAGGPEPAHEGKLNIISIHSGKMTGNIPLEFGTLEREGYKKHFLPMYGHFLKKCYLIEECHARALKPEDSLSLENTDPVKENASYFSVDAILGGLDAVQQVLKMTLLLPASISTTLQDDLSCQGPTASHPSLPSPSHPLSLVPSQPNSPALSRPNSPALSHPNSPAPSCPNLPVPAIPASPPNLPAPSRPNSPALSVPASPPHFPPPFPPDSPQLSSGPILPLSSNMLVSEPEPASSTVDTTHEPGPLSSDCASISQGRRTSKQC